MRISVFGLGYVGAVTTACLAKLGHRVVGIDVSEPKVNAVAEGKAPILEPGLDELLRQGRQNGCISATTNVSEAVRESDVGIVCVGTPSTVSGGIQDESVVAVVQQICEELRASETPRRFAIIVRSTCLPDVHEKLQELIGPAKEDRPGLRIEYVCHPEFLREGTAVHDFFEPPKIVFGLATEEAKAICERLYPMISAPTAFVPIGVASMIKYADNCFHAAKVTFANEIGLLCKRLRVDSRQVMEVFCSDTKLNISPRYLRPGAPFGGSCLPKDLRAMLDLARRTATSTQMLAGIAESNRRQIDMIVSRILGTGKRNIGIVGLAFKENTDDLRESPAVTIAEQLLGKGITLRIFDPYLSVDELVGANLRFALDSIPHLSSWLCSELSDVISASDIVLTFHRVAPDDWCALHSADTKPEIIDFTNQISGAEGIYW